MESKALREELERKMANLEGQLEATRAIWAVLYAGEEVAVQARQPQVHTTPTRTTRTRTPQRRRRRGPRTPSTEDLAYLRQLLQDAEIDGVNFITQADFRNQHPTASRGAASPRASVAFQYAERNALLERLPEDRGKDKNVRFRRGPAWSGPSVNGAGVGDRRVVGMP